MHVLAPRRVGVCTRRLPLVLVLPLPSHIIPGCDSALTADEHPPAQFLTSSPAPPRVIPSIALMHPPPARAGRGLFSSLRATA